MRCLAAFLLAVLASSAARADETLRVLATTSLRESFGEMARAFERTRPGTRVELEFAGADDLRSRLARGEPADVIAADLVQSRAPAFARSALAVVVPARRPIVTELAHVARPNTRIAIADTLVAAGRATAALLQRLDESGRFGPQFKLRVLVNVVSEEPDVRDVLDRVADGKADAGFVYATDAARAGKRVRTVAIPPELEVSASFTLAVTHDASSPGLARAFEAFVRSTDGQAILQRYGFSAP